MQSFDWGQFVASTVFVLLLLLGALWWAKRNQSMLAQGQVEKRIHVVESMPLSLKHKMVLIQVDNQMVLATISPAEVKTLHACTKENPNAA